MSLLATLQQTTTWTQKQIIGFFVIGVPLAFIGIRSMRKGGWLVFVGIAAVLLWLGRGIGTPR